MYVYTRLGGHEFDIAQGLRLDGRFPAGRPEGQMPERELCPGAGGQDPNVEADHPVFGAAGVHTVRGPLERHARPPPPSAHVHPGGRPTADGRVQRAERVQLALVARRSRNQRVPDPRRHRVPHMLRGRRRVLRGRHHQGRRPDQAHRHAHVAVFRGHADRRVHRRHTERRDRFLRHVLRVHNHELSGAVTGRRYDQGHVRPVREAVRLADDQPESDRRLDARASQKTAEQEAPRIHDNRVAAYHRTHARCVYVIMLISPSYEIIQLIVPPGYFENYIISIIFSCFSTELQITKI